MKEEWKLIGECKTSWADRLPEKYGDRTTKYLVSSLGNTKKIKWDGTELPLNQYIIGGKNNGNGYYAIAKMDFKDRYVHRLIGKLFIDNPYNKPTINHKNGDKRDNRVENLEWATYQEQMDHVKEYNLRSTLTDRQLSDNKITRERERRVEQFERQQTLQQNYKEVFNELVKSHKNKTYSKGPELFNKVKELYSYRNQNIRRNRLLTTDIGRILNVNFSLVKVYIKHINYPENMPQYLKSDYLKEAKEVTALYNKGLKLREIVEIKGTSIGAVYNLIRRARKNYGV
tara:strand:- start:37 stop:894 length:858 start_codon:yes stop_codon:yes gene_type:complete